MSSEKRKSASQKVPEAGDPSQTAPRGKLWAKVAPAGLAVLLIAVYGSGLHPGVDLFDSAELQYMSPLLGICHPPGYQIEVGFGKLFSLLPVGESAAWRINLMMLICGVIGALSLYGAVTRITKKPLAGLIAGATLGFSTIYWMHCLVAEVYVFYGMFLLLGLYAAVRFVQSDKCLWLYLTAILVGVAIADRPSELFVLPGFLGLYLGFRKKVHLGLVRIAVSVLLFILPFAFSVVCFMVRNDAQNPPHRDDILRDKILSLSPSQITRGYDPDASVAQKLTNAVGYSLGLKWTRKAGFSFEHLIPDIKNYAWMLSGAGAFGKRYLQVDPRSMGQRSGTSIGILGLALAVIGTIRWRGKGGWVLLGWGLFLGNLVFILWHHTPDNLTFTVPGLTGLGLLAGLGAGIVADIKKGGKLSLVLRICCLLVPLFLLISNYRFVDRSREADHKMHAVRQRIARAPWPENSVLICSNWRGMTCRYLLWIEANRTDCHVIISRSTDLTELIRYFDAKGLPVFVIHDIVHPRTRELMLPITPRGLAKVGFLRVSPRLMGTIIEGGAGTLQLIPD